MIVSVPKYKSSCEFECWQMLGRCSVFICQPCLHKETLHYHKNSKANTSFNFVAIKLRARNKFLQTCRRQRCQITSEIQTFNNLSFLHAAIKLRSRNKYFADLLPPKMSDHFLNTNFWESVSVRAVRSILLETRISLVSRVL